MVEVLERGTDAEDSTVDRDAAKKKETLEQLAANLKEDALLEDETAPIYSEDEQTIKVFMRGTDAAFALAVGMSIGVALANGDTSDATLCASPVTDPHSGVITVTIEYWKTKRSAESDS